MPEDCEVMQKVSVKKSAFSVERAPEKKLDKGESINNIKVKSDEESNIVYPIVVSDGLRILNLGVIDYQRTAFHSPTNIFPIGFKSVRTFSSIIEVGKRAEYTNEIIDDGQKPIFKVTCSEDLQNPIVKDSASAAWLEVIKKINNL